MRMELLSKSAFSNPNFGAIEMENPFDDKFFENVLSSLEALDAAAEKQKKDKEAQEGKEDE